MLSFRADKAGRRTSRSGDRIDGPAGAQDPAFLDIRAVEKAFGSATVLGGVDLKVARGEFVSLLGPSGCGKTTLLRIVAGLLAPDRGSLRLDGEDIARKPPHHRDISVVFQSYALFPHLTVAENVAFGLEARKLRRDEIRPIVARFLDLVHLSSFADHSVRALSGGQQQRVAVARALAVRPKLLLLDEPFSALDRKLRETMQIELKRLLRELGATSVFVTHDQDEALMMSDRIAVMNRGAIEQIADPATIYRRPATPFALEFVGLSTRLFGKVTAASADGHVVADTCVGPVRGQGRCAVGADVLIGIRPERMRLGSGGDNAVQAVLRDVVFQGSKLQMHFEAPAGEQIMVETAEAPDIDLAPGARLDLSWRSADTLVYAAARQP